MSDKKTVDFAAEDRTLRLSDKPFELKQKAIMERETADQNARADRGGTISSSLSPEAEAAMKAVIRQRDAARAALAKPVLAAARAEQTRLVSAAATAARDFLKARVELATLEHNANLYCIAAGQSP